MKKTLLSIFCFLYCLHICGAQSNIKTINLAQIDSIIHQQPNTAILYWGTWCVPCVADVVKVVRAFDKKKLTRILLIADPSSNNKKIESLIASYGTAASFYKLMPAEPDVVSARRIIRVNDMQQTRIFNRHFTHNISKEANMKFAAFYLLDSTGKVLCTNSAAIPMDSAIAIGAFICQ